MRTWAMSHYALSREEVNAQLRNNLMHVIEQNKINHVRLSIQSNGFSKETSNNVGPPPKPDLFVSESIL